ncbi:MAG: hypothetical protein ACYS9X_19065 [Planctomycetota bacterium]|jgi:hypothetical protein
MPCLQPSTESLRTDAMNKGVRPRPDVARLTATAFNAEDAEAAENGELQGNGHVKLRDVLGALGVLGVERGAPLTATASNSVDGNRIQRQVRRGRRERRTSGERKRQVLTFSATSALSALREVRR